MNGDCSKLSLEELDCLEQGRPESEWCKSCHEFALAEMQWAHDEGWA